MSNRLNQYAVIIINLGLMPMASADSNIIFDGSTGNGNQNVAVTDNAHDGVYVIDSTDGSSKGGNLFHSFSDFNVSSGDTASFTDSTSSNYNNVIVRVTGGKESSIRGEISTDANLGDANLYLLNPNGILFGEGASLNIGGSFHASTADQLIFGSAQDQIMPTGSTESKFYSAPVESFGFLSSNPAPITVTDTVLEVNIGQQLSLIAGDISLTVSDPSLFSAGLKARDGNINITSVAGNTNVPVDNSNYSPSSELGAISISNGASIDTSGDSGGHIIIRGGSLTMNQKGSIKNNIAVASTHTQSESVAGIDIGIAGSISLDNQSFIEANSGFGATSRSDGIYIQASNLTLSNRSTIESTMGNGASVNEPENYNEGLINIDVENTIDISGRSKITTTNKGTGAAASIALRADTIKISDGAVVDASAFFRNTSGYGGDIDVDANTLEIIGDTNRAPSPLSLTGIQSNGARSGTQSGNITVNSQEILLKDNGAIQANSYGDTRGGDINLTAENGAISLLNGGQIRILGAGSAGNINLNSDSVLLSGASIRDGSTVFQQSRIVNKSRSSSADSGNININSDQFTMANGAKIVTATAQNQTGGNVNITATNIDISGYSQTIIDSEMTQEGVTISDAMLTAATNIDVQSILEPIDTTTTNGNSGSNILMTANSINISDSAILSTATFGQAENAGNISIQADDIKIESNALITSTQDFNYGTNQPTGNIKISANNSLHIKDSTISTKVNSLTGKGGNISITANSLFLSGATIDTSANQGNGGNIRINSNKSIISADTVFDAHSENAIDGVIEIQTIWQEDSSFHEPNQDYLNKPLLNISTCEIDKVNDASTLMLSQRNKQYDTHYFAENYAISSFNINSIFKQIEMTKISFSDCRSNSRFQQGSLSSNM